MELQPLPPVEERAALRQAFSRTQQDIADMLEVRRETISRWESGAKEPTGLKGAQYANLLARFQEIIEESRARSKAIS